MAVDMAIIQLKQHIGNGDGRKAIDVLNSLKLNDLQQVLLKCGFSVHSIKSKQGLLSSVQNQFFNAIKERACPRGF